MARDPRKTTALMVLAALALMPAGVCVAEESKPEIVIEAMRHDLGDIYEQESYVHTFEVKNAGSADLKIEHVKPGCGCTVAKYDEVIMPGQVGKITLEIEGDQVSGRFSKAATVHSNDPGHPTVSISLAGSILQYIEIDPRRVYLRGMYGEPVTKVLSVASNVDKNDFEILGVTSTIDDKITYRVEAGGEAGSYNVMLFKNPRLPTLNTWGSLTIESNSKHKPKKVVQVNVVTRGAIVAQPTTLNFGAVQAGSSIGAHGVEKELTVFKVKGDFNITDISFSSKRYQATVEEIEQGKKYRVVVGFMPGSSQQSFVDEMIISTDDPNEPSIRVRLLARQV